MLRSGNRAPDQLRPIEFETHFTKYAEGSVLIACGDTRVLCNATIDETLPGWLRQRANPHGWLTAEYAMLPRSTKTRTQREQKWPRGRTQEISRLIGRSLRMAVDLHALGERQIIVDCDVLQADGGTRTAAISGGWVAVVLALQPLIRQGRLPSGVLRDQIAAVSVGVVAGTPVLDLAYEEDVAAESDVNIVMTADGRLVEIQGTAESKPFARDVLQRLLDLAEAGISELAVLQSAAINRSGSATQSSDDAKGI